MSTTEPADLRDLVARHSREAAARRAAHPDHDVLSVLGPLDVMPQALRGVLDLRRDDTGVWLGRRADSLSLHFYTVATADGEPDVELLWRWATERDLVPDVEITAADRHRVTRQVVALAERDEQQAARMRESATLTTQEHVTGRRFLSRWACRLDDRGHLVGHGRDREPSATALAEHEAKTSNLSPISRAMSSRGGPRWPDDCEITTDLVRDEAALFGLVQRHETAPDWAEVVAEIRALVAS